MKTLKILNTKKIKDIKTVVFVLLENRGIKSKKEIHDFLNPNMEGLTLGKAGVEENEILKTFNLIKKCIKNKKSIIIFGDYDVDGICATAILWETLYKIYKNVYPYIPHRAEEGYGLSEKGIENIRKKYKDCGLIITVDNGIVAHNAVSFANSKKIDVVITDHHLKGDLLPSASAIIHTTILCGAGISYFLSFEIAKYFRVSFNENIMELVVLATIADLVPLNNFNRALVKFGLEKLRSTNRIGLVELISEAKIDKDRIDTYEIGHIIAPRLNATGRITHAINSLRLICTNDKVRAKKLAKTLSETNRQRQNLTIELSNNAISQIKTLNTETINIIFAVSEAFEEGVIGLIASRLVEKFYRPAIVVSKTLSVSKGSARSISGINIIELIRSSSNLLLNVGGHPMAAGFSIETEKIEIFKEDIKKNLNEIDRKVFVREIVADMELPWNLITFELYYQIQDLKPFGVSNPSPAFLTKSVNVIRVNKVGKNNEHAQLLLEKDGTFFKGVIFNYTDKKNINEKDIVNIIYSIEVNSWKGKETLELRIKHLF